MFDCLRSPAHDLPVSCSARNKTTHVNLAAEPPAIPAIRWQRERRALGGKMLQLNRQGQAGSRGDLCWKEAQAAQELIQRVRLIWLPLFALHKPCLAPPFPFVHLVIQHRPPTQACSFRGQHAHENMGGRISWPASCAARARGGAARRCLPQTTGGTHLSTGAAHRRGVGSRRLRVPVLSGS